MQNSENIRTKMTNETLDQMWNILKDNEFQKDVTMNSEILCTSCKRIMIQPRIVPCGCKYCYDCLISYLNGEEKFCLGDSRYCKNELINIDKNVFIDQPANIKISRIVVKCPPASCEFHAELGKMADHMRTCDKQPVTCPYSAIGCQENKIGDDKMKLHFKQENYCHGRLLMEFLENWKNEVKLLKSTMLDLKEENKWIREQMESKQEKISELEENVGKLLEENRTLKELETEKTHQNNETKEMVSEMQKKSKELKEEMEKNKNKLQEMEMSQELMRTGIEGINQENKSLREELQIIKLDNKTKGERISALQATSNENERELRKGKEKLEQFQEKVKTRIDKMSDENVIMETKLTQVQANQNWSEFVWYIADWNEKKKRAQKGIQTVIHSDPFFSHKNGYEMCLRLDPDGNGTGKGTYLSLYMCIMRGKFDSILQWPFRHAIKFELMNQETGLAHVSRIVDSKNNKDDDCWKKPDKERNDGCGYKFIELSELVSNAALCRGNQIFIKATPQMNP